MSCQCEDPCDKKAATQAATPLQDLIPILEGIGFCLLEQREGWRLYGKTTAGTFTRPIAYRLFDRLKIPFLHLNKDVETTLLGYFSRFYLFTDEGTLDGGYVEASISGNYIERQELRANLQKSPLEGRRMCMMKVALVWQNPESLPEYQ